jgi:hypothetical protein
LVCGRFGQEEWDPDWFAAAAFFKAGGKPGLGFHVELSRKPSHWRFDELQTAPNSSEPGAQGSTWNNLPASQPHFHSLPSTRLSIITTGLKLIRHHPCSGKASADDHRFTLEDEEYLPACWQRAID